MSDIAGWFARQVPDGWFTGAPEVHVDREEIVVIGQLAGEVAGDPAEAATAFREATRDRRVGIATEAERRFGRKVSWGVEIGGQRYLFTHAAVPVMTRLRFGERAVLDTLIDAGVARSRSEALAWCVALVAENADEWLGQLREALENVQRLREQGPAGEQADEQPEQG